MARLFDGTNQYLQIEQAVVSSYPITVAVWVYRASLPVDGVRVLWLGDKDVAGQSLVDAFIRDDFVTAHCYDGGAGQAVTTAQVPNNTWSHCCFVYASTSSRAAYLNGGNKGVDVTLINPTGADRTAIGMARDSTPSWPYVGRIAEVAIWNVALTDAEVAVLALGVSPLMVRPASRVTYWPLIRSDQDIVGGYDMTAYNAPTIAEHCPILMPAPPFMIAVAIQYQGIAGALTPAGALIRAVATSKAGALTSAGALARAVATTKAGAVTPAGTIARGTSTTKAGAVTSAGAIVRKAATTKAGAVTPAGAIARKTSTPKAGAVTSAGAVSRKAATTKAGALTAAGALSRKVATSLAGAVTSAGVLTRQTTHAIAGAVATAGALAKQAHRALAGVLTPTGTSSREAHKLLAGAVTSAGTIARKTAKALAGALTLAGAVWRALAGSADRVDWTVSDSVVTAMTATSNVVTAMTLTDASRA